jgi:hypothetical protein
MTARTVADEQVDVAGVLRAARALIDTPDKWSASNGRHDGFGSRANGTVCMEGAVYVVVNGWTPSGRPNLDQVTPEIEVALRALSCAAGGRLVMRFNDAYNRTHAEVMDVWDKAIRATETKP